jgi:hypothetical protein
MAITSANAKLLPSSIYGSSDSTHLFLKIVQSFKTIWLCEYFSVIMIMGKQCGVRISIMISVAVLLPRTGEIIYTWDGASPSGAPEQPWRFPLQ